MDPVNKLRSADEWLNRVQDNILRAVNQIVKIPILDGVLTDEIDLSTSITNVEHKLGREPLGWIVVAKDANADVWEVTANNPDRARFLRLDASVTVTVRLWVF